MDWKLKLDGARMNILISNHLRLFGCLIYNFDIDIVDTKLILNDDISSNDKKAIEQGLTAMVAIINNKPTIKIYTSFIKEKKVTELVFVIIHEIMHILDGHNIRRGERKPELYNLATDHIINSTLKNDIDKKLLQNVTVPEDVFIIEELKNKKMTVSEVYEWLLTRSTIQKIGIVTVGEKGEGEEIEIDIMSVEIDGKKYQFPTDIISQSKNSSDVSKEIEINNVLLAEARAIMNNDNIISKGNTSGSLYKLLNKMIEVKIPWTEILRKTISNKIIPSEDNRSWKKLQKRPQALGIMLPGFDEEEKPAILIVGEDQSGSIKNKEIKKFASIIYQSSKFFDQIRVIKHDVKVQSDEIFEATHCTNDKILFGTFGRGGTSHKYIFDEIEKSFEEGDELSLIILLTDFESDIERIWNNYQWTKVIPVSICLTSDHNIPRYIDEKPVIIKEDR